MKNKFIKKVVTIILVTVTILLIASRAAPDTVKALTSTEEDNLVAIKNIDWEGGLEDEEPTPDFNIPEDWEDNELLEISDENYDEEEEDENIAQQGITPEEDELPLMRSTKSTRNAIANATTNSIPSSYPQTNNIIDFLKETYPATRDQTTGDKHYGTCWVHAAATLAEFYMIHNGIQESESETPITKDVNYSETQLAWFCYNQAPAPANGETGDTVTFRQDLGKKRIQLNFGGNFKYTGLALMHQIGFMKETDIVKYENAANLFANGLDATYARDLSVARVKNQYYLDVTKQDTLKKKIMSNGAISLSYYSDPKYISTYVDKATGQKVNAAYYNYVNTTLNHVVAVVGWDDNFPAENFGVKPPGNGAWLVRNSHSTETRLDEESYFWLSYYDTSIAPVGHALDMMDPDKGEWYDTIYCHDSQLHGAVAVGSQVVANVFTATDDMEIEAVQIDATTNVAGKYAVFIYTNLSDLNDPQSGNNRIFFEGKLDLPGRYTIPIPAQSNDEVLFPIFIKKGQSFSVIVKTAGQIDRETDVMPWKNQLFMDTVINRGESFILTNDGWVDLADNTKSGTRGNACIRVLGNKIAEIEEIPASSSLQDEESEENPEEHLTSGQNKDPEITKLSLNTKKISLRAPMSGNTFTTKITASVETSAPTVKNDLKWTTNKPWVVKVTGNIDDTATIEATGCGVATITVKAGTKTDTCTVIVYQNVYECTKELIGTEKDKNGKKKKVSRIVYRYLCNYDTVKSLKSDGWTCTKKWKAIAPKTYIVKDNTTGKKWYTSDKNVALLERDLYGNYVSVLKDEKMPGNIVWYAYNSTTKERWYSTDKKRIEEAKKKGFSTGIAFRSPKATWTACKIQPVYELDKDGSWYYTSDRSLALSMKNKKGWTSHGIAWYELCP